MNKEAFIKSEIFSSVIMLQKMEKDSLFTIVKSMKTETYQKSKVIMNIIQIILAVVTLILVIFFSLLSLMLR